jgi:hypothetical protein
MFGRCSATIAIAPHGKSANQVYFVPHDVRDVVSWSEIAPECAVSERKQLENKTSRISGQR